MKPAREHATNNAQTYFVTANTWESRALFCAEPRAKLFFQNLLAHWDSYLLHEFVLMQDHFHLLVSPSIPLERTIQLNPVKKHLCEQPSEYKYSSAYPGWKLDRIPQGLKPRDFLETASGTAKAVPFQNTSDATVGVATATLFQNNSGATEGTAKTAPFQSQRS